MEVNQVWHGDCLELMKRLPDKSIDLILCDLPYGTTACKWDSVIPFEPLWEQYKRIVKPNVAIVLTASQPFASQLVMSNFEWFKYEWIWDKKKSGNIFLAKYQPMKIHENILVFGCGKHKYNPQTTPRDTVRYSKNYGTGKAFGENGQKENCIYEYKERNPVSVVTISNASQLGKTHPTQKPVALFEYLIKTYTNEGDLVLDNCAGSGTTGIAALNTGRNYILMEKEKEYFDLINQRIANHTVQLSLAV